MEVKNKIKKNVSQMTSPYSPFLGWSDLISLQNQKKKGNTRVDPPSFIVCV